MLCVSYRNIKTKIHRTIILPVVLYGCETWSLTLREEHRLRVLENRVMRRIFEPKRCEVPGKHSIDSVQRTAILGTSHIIRKVLQCEA